MSATIALAGAVQLGGALLVAPLLVGLTQHLKGVLQGRPGPVVVQPLRELRRLWGKTAVAPEPRTFVYALAPALVAAATLLALLLVPVGGAGGPWQLGHDALLIVGLLTLARFAIALASWDTGGGFGLMGAARDLAIAVSVEALLLAVFLLLALPAHSTDLRVLADAATDASVWRQPAHWAAALGFLLVVLAETGRQPIDNPDTHLELTMIHEGPLLEYGGRDLAYLQWAAAARHWLVLVLGTELLVPQPHDFGLRLLVLAAALPLWCCLLALCETTQAKMRLLRVPVLLGAGVAVCALGFASWLAGVGT